MKPSLIFSQYVWLVNTLRWCGRLTLEELNDKWIRDEVALWSSPWMVYQHGGSFGLSWHNQTRTWTILIERYGLDLS